MPQMLTTYSARTTRSLDIDARYHEVSRQVTALQRRCRQGLYCERSLKLLSDQLATLPLTTEDYSRACCHLANATRYLAAEEGGAANYELRMLAGVLVTVE